jgi:alpha-L-fucosidase
MVVEDEPSAEFSYPALLQDSTGRCHLLYTYRRETIKHLNFEEPGHGRARL